MSDFVKLRWSIAHDPCRASHRSPLNAVPVGTSVEVLLWVDRHARHQVSGATLLVGVPEQNSESLYWSETPLVSCERGYCGYIAGPDHPSAAFYLFRLYLSDGGTAYYVPRDDGRSTAGMLVAPGFDGEFTDRGWVNPSWRDKPFTAGQNEMNPQLPGFQITFFNPSFQTPDWLPGSVMYQIFPDRFARGTEGVLKDAIEYHRAMGRPVNLHVGWDEPVVWEGGVTYDPIDFYGGTLAGIREKLPYLASLGVEVLYLNPIFEARSNHRYDTANYEHIDPLLGTDEEFELLASEAKEQGIHIVLDAVLSHTGADSVYFNMLETYPDPGAAQGWESPYYSWYDFDHPSGPSALYRCWWGDSTLPEVDERNPSWQQYILGNPEDGSQGILGRWLAAGASGYRLDVADEIPDDVLMLIHDSVKTADPQAIVLGEVWEDATNKVSYGSWRTFGLGTSLDSVMNYPLRSALLGFARGTIDALQLSTMLKLQKSNYPEPLYRCLMNLMSSHDVERQRSVLALGSPIKQLARDRQADMLANITPEQDKRAARLQRLIAGLLYGLPGMPCLYYGDERGLHGGGDPFCRGTFPWDDTERPDRGADLTAFYQHLGQLRQKSPLLREGNMYCDATDEDALCIVRSSADNSNAILVAANRSNSAITVAFDSRDLGQMIAPTWRFHPIWSSDLDMTRAQAQNEGGIIHVTIPPLATVYFAS